MPVNNGVISAPVSASDPYNCMGIGMYNGMFDVGWACSNLHGNINVGSRYKPIASPKLEELTDINYIEANWGYIAPMTIPSIVTFVDNAISNSNWSYDSLLGDMSRYVKLPGGWLYEPPRVDNGSYFRLTDFNKYNHNLTRDLGVCYIGEEITQNGSIGASVYFNSFTLTDFVLTRDSYVAIAVRKVSGGTIYFIGSDTVNADSAGFSSAETKRIIDGSGYGEYYCIPFLTKQTNLNSFNGDKAVGILPFPAITKFIIKFVAPVIIKYISLSGSIVRISRNNIEVSVIIKALEAVSFRSGSLQFQIAWENIDGSNSGLGSMLTYISGENHDLRKGESVTLANNVIYHDINKYSTSYFAHINFYYPKSNGSVDFVGVLEWTYDM